jgi:hypothetical protein
MHKGFTKLRKPADPDRPYVIIIGSQWQGSKDFGYIVSAKEAVQEILKSGNTEVADKYPELKAELKAMIEEMTETEEA